MTLRKFKSLSESHSQQLAAFPYRTVARNVDTSLLAAKVVNSLFLNTSYNRLLLIFMTVSMFYNWYRYPFMINSNTTSPTYVDTPLSLQYGKYIIFSLIFVLIAINRLTSVQGMVVRHPFVEIIYFYLFLMPIICGLLVKNFNLFKFGFFAVIPIIFHTYKRTGVNGNALAKFISFCIYLAIIVNFIQVALAVTIGRMPALAYPRTISIRFGSFLDDPNGFGILLALFIGFSIYYYTGIRKIIILAALISSLLLTQSLTAIFVVPISALICFMMFIKREFKRFMKLFIVINFFLAALTVKYFDIIKFYWSIKQGSVVGHGQSVATFLSLNFLNLLGVTPVNFLGESGYINMMGNFGVFYVFVFFLLGIFAIIKIFNLLTNCTVVTNKAILFGILFFLVAVYIGLINLPFENIFPINAIFYILIGIISSGIFNEVIQDKI